MNRKNCEEEEEEEKEGEDKRNIFDRFPLISTKTFKIGGTIDSRKIATPRFPSNVQRSRVAHRKDKIPLTRDRRIFLSRRITSSRLVLGVQSESNTGMKTKIAIPRCFQ